MAGSKSHKPAHGARVLALLGLCLFLAACSRPPEIVGVDNSARPVASVKDATRLKVFMATTRSATDVTGAFFSSERAPELSLTSLTVSIPPTHVTGRIERPDSLPPDPATEFAIVDPTVFGGARGFVSALNRELARRAPEDRQVLLFVHGYNSTTTDALLRISQFAADTGFKGVPVLFSWASAGKVSRYVYDINSALVARRALLETAGTILQSNTRGLNIFAHSMGSLLTVEALVQAQLYGQRDARRRLDNVMLAAPDIDLDLFRSQMAYLPGDKSNFYVFVSQKDRILKFSSLISGGVDRVGAADAAELEGTGVTVIDLSDVNDTDVADHFKFAGSPEVVALIGGSLLEGNLDLNDRRAGNAPLLVDYLDGVPVLHVPEL